MSFEFIQELSEARIFRNPKKIAAIKSSQLADNFFAAVLALDLVYQIKPSLALSYAKSTFQSGAEGWISSGSDLHNMAHMLQNLDKFREKVSTDRFTAFPKLQYKAWLRNMVTENSDDAYNRRFFLRLQKDLGIVNLSLKTSRRILADWNISSLSEKKSAATKIYNMLNQNVRQSDIFLIYTKSAIKSDLLAI